MTGTTPERVKYLKQVNGRLQRFISRALFHGWREEVSTAAPDCIIVRHPRLGDHFVLYPSGRGRTASLEVYDGRNGYEFSPIPARHALSYISTNRESD